jgi:hypothetical protein
MLAVLYHDKDFAYRSYAKDGYFRSAFFWMDFAGTLSIIIDLTWASSIVSGSEGVDPGALKAARVAKLGAKAGKLAKLTKLFKIFQLQSHNNVQEIKAAPAKKISAKMGLLLSQRVALLIMTIVMINPLLTPSITDYSASGFLLSMDAVANIDSFSAADWESAFLTFEHFYKIQELDDSHKIDLPVWLRVWNINQTNCPTQTDAAQWYISNTGSSCQWSFESFSKYNGIIRTENQRYVSSPRNAYYAGGSRCSARAPEFAYACDKIQNIDALFDSTESAVEESWMSIGIICVVIVLLIGFTATFNAAIDKLVVLPISRIMDKLRTSAEVVLKSVEKINPSEDNQDDESEQSEADILELMVNKLARIVQKSIGNKIQDVLDENEGQIDESTTAWLSANYNSDKITKPVVTTTIAKHDKPETPEKTASLIALHDSKAFNRNSLPVSADSIETFEFDILSISEELLEPVVQYMLEENEITREFGVNLSVLGGFIRRVREGYRLEPRYHSWHHGCDVLHTVYMMTKNTRASEFMTKLELFGSLVAALAHDIGHPGVNNAFLVRTKDELALLHNDASPLENMHAATLYELLRDPAVNILGGLDEEQWNSCRKQILVCIIKTDMSFHFETLKKLDMFEEVNGIFITDFLSKRAAGNAEYPVPSCLNDPNNRLLLLETILHAADLSNPLKPKAVYKKWVDRVTDEFFSQGDKELELGLPASPMCDRESTNIPKMQMGFIDFVITPFYTTIFKLFPSDLIPMATNLEENYAYYAHLRMAEEPKEAAQLTENIKKIQSKIHTALNSASTGNK